jgi:hypothetical protein
MPPSPQPFVFAGQLQLAADQSLPPDPVPFNFSSQFTSKEESVLTLTGAGALSVAFGSVGAPGAKGLLIRYDAPQTGALPILCTINGGTAPLEITPGGMLLWFNPNPTAGALALSIGYTASCQLRVWVLG